MQILLSNFHPLCSRISFASIGQRFLQSGFAMKTSWFLKRSNCDYRRTNARTRTFTFTCTFTCTHLHAAMTNIQNFPDGQVPLQESLTSAALPRAAVRVTVQYT
jgi:hypothetical protein